jgi:hypothetical protein
VRDLSKTYRYTVTFHPRADLTAVMDMLRYDNARVIAHAVITHGVTEDGPGPVHRLEFSTSPYDATIARWQSFGLYPQRTF